MEQLELELKRQRKDLAPFRVLMLSTYLTKYSKEIKPERLESWIKHGYEPKNFAGVERLKTDKGREVVLLNPNEDTSILLFNEIADFAISGSTENNEFGVAILSGSGLPIARYSIFYGKESGYTGRKPENGGYSLDIPKKTEAVQSLLQYDQFAEAILERNTNKVKIALNEFNKEREQPVIETSFLEKCLSIIPS